MHKPKTFKKRVPFYHSSIFPFPSMASSSKVAACVITTLLIFLTCLQFSTFKSPFHPRDLLPLMPKQISWPIINSLHSAVDILPVFVAAASSPNNTPEWKGACFYKNQAWMEFHNKTGSQFGGGTLHLKVVFLLLLCLNFIVLKSGLLLFLLNMLYFMLGLVVLNFCFLIFSFDFSFSVLISRF